MTNKKKTISYQDYLHRVAELERVSALGIELYYKKNKIKVVGGAVCVAVGLITLPLPTGSVFLIAVGLSLMANGGVNLYKYKNDIKRRLKVKIWGLFK